MRRVVRWTVRATMALPKNSKVVSMSKSWLIALVVLALMGCVSRTGRVDPATPVDPAVSSPASHAAVPTLDPMAELQHIGFGSCLHQDRPQKILDTVLAEDFELFLFLGDNVYGDVDRQRLDDLTPLREAYDKQQQSAGLQKLRRSTPILATWDDHDYGLNDAGADFAERAGAEALFEDFWQIPATAASTQWPGVYDSAVFGPPGRRVQIVLLDTRYFRSPLQPTDQRGPGKERYVPDEDPTKTMLGEAQWAWLSDQLQQPADLRLIVSSIQVIADGHGWEAWRMLPTERQRLYETLQKSGASGVVLLSGDRHRAGIYRHSEALGYPLYEITSSSLNLPIRDIKEESGPFRLGPTYMAENYGALTVDWSAGTVELSVRGMDGQTVLAETLSLADLGS